MLLLTYWFLVFKEVSYKVHSVTLVLCLSLIDTFPELIHLLRSFFMLREASVEYALANLCKKLITWDRVDNERILEPVDVLARRSEHSFLFPMMFYLRAKGQSASYQWWPSVVDWGLMRSRILFLIFWIYLECDTWSFGWGEGKL